MIRLARWLAAAFRDALGAPGHCHFCFYAPGRILDDLDATAERVANPPLGTAGFCRCGERFQDDTDRARGQCPECYSRHW